MLSGVSARGTFDAGADLSGLEGRRSGFRFSATGWVEKDRVGFSLHSDTPSSMTTDESPSLDLVEQEARIAKLNAERNLLENQLSPDFRRVERWKAWSGPITAIVAISGILISTSQWYFGTKATREAQRQERIERNLDRLADKDESQRITAVASLKTVVSGEDSPAAEQTIAAFTQLLAVEGSFAVRSAIVSALSGISSSAADARRIGALRNLVGVSRGLVSEGGLQRLGGVDRKVQPEPSSVAARALSVSHAIASLLQQGARVSSLEGVYLAGENLTALNLSRADFRHAILVGTQFDNATLNSSRFDDAVLAGTSFQKSDLRNASLQQSTWNYVLDQAYPLQTSPDSRVAVIGPVFDGADLSGARFDGHPLFPIYDNKLHEHAIITGFTFIGARLNGVDLRKAWVFGFRHRDFRLPNCDMQWRRTGSLISFGGTPLELLAGQAMDEPSHAEPLPECWRTLELIAMAFSRATRSNELSLNFIDAAVTSGRFAVPTETNVPSSEVMQYLREGRDHYLRHEFKEAVSPYARALELEKQHPTLDKPRWLSLVLDLGIAYGTSGNVAKAKETFEYGLSKDSAYPLFYYNLACTYGEMNDVEGAVTNLNLAFKNRASPIGGYQIPDPEKDNSFRRLLTNDRFINALREIREGAGKPGG